MRLPGGLSNDLLEDGDMLVGIDGVERSEMPGLNSGIDGLETNEMPGHSSLYSSVWLRTCSLNSDSGGNATPSTPLDRDPEFMPLEHVAERYDAYFGIIELPQTPTSRADPEYMWHCSQMSVDPIHGKCRGPSDFHRTTLWGRGEAGGMGSLI